MCNLLGRAVLLLVFMASAAIAQEREQQSRSIALPDGPDQSARPIYVAGAVATVLRFDEPVDPARTKIVGWEGRFEPLIAVGKTVVLVPLHDLTPEDRLPLVVALTDGTQVPFTVTAETDRVDHQVNLYRDRDSELYLRAALDEARWRERFVLQENERFEKEENSPDHALAALLASESVKQTPFRRVRRWAFKEADADIDVTVYSGKSKAAVLFQITNHAERLWGLLEARLTSGADLNKASAPQRQCAVRMLPHAIAPGHSGAVAVVADKSAFASERGLETLALQIIRQDGLVQARVMLDPALVRE